MVIQDLDDEAKEWIQQRLQGFGQLICFSSLFCFQNTAVLSKQLPLTSLGNESMFGCDQHAG